MSRDICLDRLDVVKTVVNAIEHSDQHVLRHCVRTRLACHLEQTYIDYMGGAP